MSVALVIVFISCIFAGMGLTFLTGLRMRLEERFFSGWIIGIMAVTISSMLSTRLFNFNTASVMAGCFLASAATLGLWASNREVIGEEYASFKKRLPQIRNGDSPLVLLALIVPFWAAIIGLFYHAYSYNENGDLLVGHLASFSDWQAHLTYTASFARANNTGLELAFAQGYKLNYHAGMNFFSALLVGAGLEVPASLQVGGAFTLMAFPGVMYSAGMRIFRSQAVSVLGTFLFLCFGGLGWTRFITDIQEHNAAQIPNKGSFFEALPRTYTRMPSAAEGSYVFENPIVGHFYPQRPTLIALPLVLIVLSWLYTAYNDIADDAKDHSQLLLTLGVLVGLSPFFSLFGFGTPLIFVGCWWLMTRMKKDFLWFLVPAVVLALPMVIYMRPPSSSLEIPYDWVTRIVHGTAPADFSHWDRFSLFVTFWAKNMGPFLPLLAAATFIPNILPKRLRYGLAPVWLFFIGPNMVKPHPWDGNNTHYFIFVALIGALPVAALLVRAVQTTPWASLVVAPLVMSMTLAGVVDIYATHGRSQPYPVVAMDRAGMALSKWANNTHPDSVFVIELGWDGNHWPHQHPLQTLSGRKVVIANDGWVHDLGIPDWSQRSGDMKAILEAQPHHQELIRKYDVDYLVVSPNSRTPNWDPNYEHWNANAKVVYNNGGWIVYKVS